MHSWDFPTFLEEGEEIYPTVAIHSLEAGPQSSLQWQLPDTLETPTLWELQFDFEKLQRPLSDPQQFQTLALACDHFMEKVWTRYEQNILGCILYRGDLSIEPPPMDETAEQNWCAWQEEQESKEEALYHRDVWASFLGLLSERLPEVPCFLLLDVGHHSRLLQGQLLDRTTWKGLHPIPQKGEAWEPLTWQEKEVHTAALDAAPPFAVCLPTHYVPGTRFSKAVGALQQPFRWIPEEYLVTEWYGVDEILVDTQVQAPGTQRMLDGFAAAGGNALLA